MGIKNSLTYASLLVIEYTLSNGLNVAVTLLNLLKAILGNLHNDHLQALPVTLRASKNKCQQGKHES